MPGLLPGRRRVLCAACALPLSIGLAARAASYVDPLDTPALLSPRAPKSFLSAVVRSAPDRWVAVGRRGHVLLSGDGSNWQQAQVPVSTDLTSVYFTNAQHGWAAGQGGVILSTSDGGQHWARQLDGRQAARSLVEHLQAQDPAASAVQEDLSDAKRWVESGPGRPFLDVWFAPDGRRGFAIGAYNLLFSTDDGGQHWQAQPGWLSNENKLHLNAIRTVGDGLYIAGEQGVLARWNAAANRFDRLTSPYAGSFFGLVGRERLLLAFGLQGHVVRSRDGGDTWEQRETGVQSALTCGTFTDDGRIVLGAQSGALLVSADGGERFTLVSPELPQPLHGVAPGPSNDSVVTVGSRGARLLPLK